MSTAFAQRLLGRWVVRAAVVLLALGVVAVVIVLALSRTARGASFEQITLDAAHGTLRVTAYREEGMFLPVPGAFYTYEFQSGHDGQWREIATFRHDDAIAIPRDQVQLVSDDVIDFYIGWMYAVTTDGGGSWTVWDAARDLEGWQAADYGFIKSVQLSSDGAGVMRVNPLRFAAHELQTVDYGRTWRVPGRP